MVVKKTWLLIYCCTLLLAGCKLASNPVQRAAGSMEGNWICTDVLNQIAQAKSIRQLKDYPPYTELIFMQDSSKLLALNGQVDMITLSYTYLSGGDALQVSDLEGNEEAYIKVIGDSMLMLSNNFSTDMWRYVKVAPESVSPTGSVDVPEVFPLLLNHTLISGAYTVKNVDEPYRIVFRNNGYIACSSDFTRYSLCYNGSCNTYSHQDLIYLSNERYGDFYGWKIQDSTLTIYSLLPVSMPDEITEYKLDKPIWVMEKMTAAI
ncbi:MAG: hypothetical protein LBB79_01130 [Prevotellaceae bacterium]|jgi:hypothetical protein|nr:hypothetical protein [Prevotellaceae bacterium]